MRIAFIPSAPFLLPGFVPPADLLAACRRAVATLGPDVTVAGAAPTEGVLTGTVDPTPWGVPGAPADDPLPLALAVGRTLLGRESVLLGVRDSLGPTTGDLLVVADGTARRTEKAPGHLDDRAQAYDEAVLAAVRAGDPAALAGLDPVLGAALLAGGVPVWRALGAAVAGRFTADLLYAGAPFGVGYVVATWCGPLRLPSLP